MRTVTESQSFKFSLKRLFAVLALSLGIYGFISLREYGRHLECEGGLKLIGLALMIWRISTRMRH